MRSKVVKFGTLLSLAYTVRSWPVFDQISRLTTHFDVGPTSSITMHLSSCSVQGGTEGRYAAPDTRSDDRMDFWHVRNFGQLSLGSHTVEAEPRADSFVLTAPAGSGKQSVWMPWQHAHNKEKIKQRYSNNSIANVSYQGKNSKSEQVITLLSTYSKPSVSPHGFLWVRLSFF